MPFCNSMVSSEDKTTFDNLCMLMVAGEGTEADFRLNLRFLDLGLHISGIVRLVGLFISDRNDCFFCMFCLNLAFDIHESLGPFEVGLLFDKTQTTFDFHDFLT